MNPRSRLARLRPRHLKWYHIYFALAGFNLMAVTASLYLTHAITGIHSQSVKDNQLWAQRLGQYAELSELAANVNAPGNDVFDSHDAPAERGRMQDALVRFEKALSAVRADLDALPSKEQSALLLGNVAGIEASMRDMLAEANQIFGYFATGDAASAGKRMATMDRKFAVLNRSFGELTSRVRAIQASQLDEQERAAELLRRYEVLMALMAVLMIGGVTAYGHKLGQAMGRAERDREMHAEALAAHARALELARDAAETASQEKTRFLARMSHEIRTPMNGVLGMTDLLIRSGLDDKQRRRAEAVQRSGTALLSIINDILDVSRIEAGKLELDLCDFDIGQCLERTVELLAEDAHRRDIDLTLLVAPDLPRMVHGDPRRLRQVVLNLVGNAIKFTESGEVSVWATRERSGDPSGPHGGSVMTIEVSDSGIGIAPEMINKLFQPFTQADSSISRKFGGTGLGLTIARQLVTLMGGSIDIRSRLGRGSTVTVTLPLRAPEGAGQALLPPTPDLQARRVLVVEPSYANRRIIESYLQACGAAVTCAGSVGGALQAVATAVEKDAPFALLVVDMLLPGMSGIELVRRLRQETGAADAAAVIVATRLGLDERAEAERSGVRHFAAKPILRAELLAAVDACLRDGMAAHAGAPPMQEQGLAGDAPPASRPVDLAVLLVEDNPVNIEVARQYLGCLECQVTIAENGQQAVEATQHQTFDIVLMDCQMPVLDGLSATRLIREAERRGARPRLPIIAVTANAFEGDRQDCLAAGMDDYLSKPFSEQQLAELLARWRGPRAGGAQSAGSQQGQLARAG